MTALGTLTRALEARGAKHEGHVWQCPAHDDGRPSLSVDRNSGGDGVVLHCFAGCVTPAVVEALGLTMSDLFDEPMKAPTPAAQYVYTDAMGQPLYRVTRTLDKRFTQARHDLHDPNANDDGYVSAPGCMRNVPRVLYRLPEVVAAVQEGRTVYVVEGEKDSDALASRGEVGTTSPGGAGKWGSVATHAREVLAGATVVIVQDKDAPGEAHARDVMASLDGVAASVRLVQAREGKDVSDHLGAGYTLGDLVAPHVITDEGDSGEDRTPWIQWDAFWSKSRTAPQWVVPNVLARGRGHAIWARGGNGKSEFVQWVSLEAIKAGHVVIYLDYEMIDDDLFDRFTDFGYGPDSDLSRFYYMLIPSLPPLDQREGALALGELIDSVRAQHPGLHVVVIIDTISRAVVGPENDNDTTLNFIRFTGKELKRREVTWARLDHTGHAGDHARGASAKRDDVDVEWQHTRTDTGCRLKRHKVRMSWVPEYVDFTREEDPLLTYRQVEHSWILGTLDTATTLDRLAVALDASTRIAQKALKDSGDGIRMQVVRSAMKYRRMNAENPGSERRDPPAGPTPRDSTGPTPGPTTQIPHTYGTDPPRDPLGPTLTGSLGPSGGPYRGPPVAPAQSDNGNRLIEGHHVDPDGHALRGAS